VVAGASLVLTANANAIPGPNAIPEVITAVGSDTTFAVDNAIFAAANADPVNTDPDNYVNVPPTLAPGAPCFNVPGDRYYGAFSYCNPATATSPLPPDGSTAGKTALNNSAATGQIDIARSSSGKGASDPLTFEYYGYAKDGVSWAASSTGAGANVTLTIAQLRGIYDGSITNWSTVGGTNTPIKVYLPQAGSGTLSFFTNKVLLFDPTTKPVTISRFQENDATSIPTADQASAIVPFSVANWVAQGNNVVTPDKRAGFFEGTLTGAGSDGPPVTGTPGTYARVPPRFPRRAHGLPRGGHPHAVLRCGTQHRRLGRSRPELAVQQRPGQHADAVQLPAATVHRWRDLHQGMTRNNN
jgi:phosphate transport system substrate-binding protein